MTVSPVPIQPQAPVPTQWQPSTPFVVLAGIPGAWFEPPVAEGVLFEVTNESVFTEIQLAGDIDGLDLFVEDVLLGTFTGQADVRFEDFAPQLVALLVENNGQMGVRSFRVEGTLEPLRIGASGDSVDFRQFPLTTLAPIILQAGDADQDLAFNQLDLVQVQIAAKYLTGQPATWGDGDWDGAPGGIPGNPPAGDGMFNQLDIVAALAPAHYLTGPYVALQPDGQASDGQTSIVYDASTGEVSVDAPLDKELTSINIDSAAGIFTGNAAENLGGSFDNDADSNIFKATFGGSFGSLSFGKIAQPGLAETFLLEDLTAVISLQGGGALGDVDLIYVPEPASLALLVLSLAFAVCRPRGNTVP